MRALWALIALMEVGCAGPVLVTVGEPGADAGGGDGGAAGAVRERLVKVLYAYQVELGEDAAWSAFVEGQARGDDPQGVRVQFAVFAFGQEGGALAVPFGSRAALRAAGRRQQPLRVLDEPGEPGTPGLRQIALALDAVVELVRSDARSLTPFDLGRVEYRVLFVTREDAFGAACEPIRCSLAPGELYCCNAQAVGAVRRMRSFLELWDQGRVTTQPVRVANGPVDPVDTSLLEAVARESGTRLITTTGASLAATLSGMELLRTP